MLTWNTQREISKMYAITCNTSYKKYKGQDLTVKPTTVFTPCLKENSAMTTTENPFIHRSCKNDLTKLLPSLTFMTEAECKGLRSKWT